MKKIGLILLLLSGALVMVSSPSMACGSDADCSTSQFCNVTTGQCQNLLCESGINCFGASCCGSFVGNTPSGVVTNGKCESTCGASNERGTLNSGASCSDLGGTGAPGSSCYLCNPDCPESCTTGQWDCFNCRATLPSCPSTPGPTPPTTPEPEPSCMCAFSFTTAGSCGVSCPSGQRQQIKVYNAFPVGCKTCDPEITCVADASCPIEQPGDTTPPQLSNPQPSAVLPWQSTFVNISLSTNETATCRFDTQDRSYDQMMYVMQGTNAAFHWHTIQPLLPGQNYTYYIRCADTSGNASLNSLPIQITVANQPAQPPPPPPPPADTQAPTSPTPVTVMTSGDSFVSLTWPASTDNVGVTGYRLDVARDPFFAEMVQSGVDTGTSLSYQIESLITGTVYYARVRARDAAGNFSAFSTTVPLTARRAGYRTPGGLLFQWKNSSDPNSRSKGSSKMAKVNAREASIGGSSLRAMSVSVPSGLSEEQIALELMSTGAFEFVEPDYESGPALLPNDPGYANQWTPAALGLPAAWDIVTGNPSLKVAVLDSGFDVAHPDLAANLRLPGLNSLDGSSDIVPIDNHGTAVAGSMAAVGNNGVGLAGVMWSAQIIPVKLMGMVNGTPVSTCSSQTRAIEMAADAGAKVINLSYHTLEDCPMALNVSSKYAWDKGSLVFIAAGNHSRNMTPTCPTPTTVRNPLLPDSPTQPKYFMVIGAMAADQSLATFSNYGNCTDLVAPGVDIFTTNWKQGYYYTPGTSFSSPITAGVAGLIYSLNPNFTPQQVRDWMLNNAQDLNDANLFGRGLVRADRAVSAASRAVVPQLSGASPTSLLVGGTTLQVTLTGAFLKGAVAQWNGENRISVLRSPTELVMTLTTQDLAVAGTGRIRVMSGSGAPSSDLSYSILNPVPQIVSATPATLPAGSPDTAITLSGTGFLSGSIVRWNGEDRLTTWLAESSSLRVTLRAEDLISASTGALTVRNAPLGGGTSGAFEFVVADSSAPIIMGLDPISLLVNAAQRTISLNGRAFQPGDIGQWNGQDRPTQWLSATQLQVTLSAVDVADQNTGKIRVRSQAIFSNAVDLPIRNPVPVVLQISPEDMQTGSAVFPLIVTGDKFVRSSQVRWKNELLATTYISATRLQALVPSVLLEKGEVLDVRVYTPGSGDSPTSKSFRLFNPSQPRITAINPLSAIAGSTSLEISVYGSGFSRASIVEWNYTSRATTFVSASELKAYVSTSDIATVAVSSIQVVNPAPGGGLSNIKHFATLGNYQLVIKSLSPAQVTAGSPGFILRLAVNSGGPASVVRWNNVDRPTLFDGNSTEVRVQVSAQDIANPGTVQIEYYKPEMGPERSQKVSFVILPPVPTLNALIPANGVAGTDQPKLVLKGTGFSIRSTVKWNGSHRGARYVSPTELEVALTAADLLIAGNQQIRVVDSAPEVTFESQLMEWPILNPVPRLEDVSPDGMRPNQTGGVVTLTGSGFVPASLVRWRGIDHVAEWKNSTELRVLLEPQDVAEEQTIHFTVVNPAPGGGESSTQMDFRVISPAPVIETVSPDVLTMGDPDQRIDISGKDFEAGAYVLWGDQEITPLDVNETQLSFMVSSSQFQEEKHVAVQIVNPDQKKSDIYEVWVVLPLEPPETEVEDSTVRAGARGAVQFDWVIVPESSVSVEGRTGPSGRMKAQTLSGNARTLRTSTNHVDLRTLSLPPGWYVVQVTAYNRAGKASAPATTRVLLASLSSPGARIYPNPWRADRHSGTTAGITFDQLVPGSVIKIFTLSAHAVVSFTVPDSGSVTWNLKNDSGDLSASGVYLFVITSPGADPQRGKFSIIR